MDNSYIDDVLGTGPQVIPAVAPQQQARPAFRLVKLPPRTRKVTKCIRDESGFRMVEEDVTDDAPYMVQMMKGHSVYISSLDELRSLKLAAYVPVLKDDTFDEPVMHLRADAVVVDKRNKQ